jgi:hypothetical protein
MANKKDQKASMSVVILPAIIAALAGIIGSFFSYKAGIATIQIPLNATQTAESRQQVFTATSPAIPTTAIQENIPIAIDKKKDWQKTGVSVNKGDSISIQVIGGKWTTSRVLMSVDEKESLPPNIKVLQIFSYPQFEQDGQGLYESCNKYNVKNCPVPDAPWGALVARINYGVPFLVGNKNVVVSPTDGGFFLGINDDQNELMDNVGVLAVTIEVIK